MKLMGQIFFVSALWSATLLLGGVSTTAWAKPSWQPDAPTNPAPSEAPTYPWWLDPERPFEIENPVRPEPGPFLVPLPEDIKPTSPLPPPPPRRLICIKLPYIAICVDEEWIPEFPKLPTWLFNGPSFTDWRQQENIGQAQNRRGAPVSVRYISLECGSWFVGPHGNWANVLGVYRDQVVFNPDGSRTASRRFVGVSMNFPLADQSPETLNEAAEEIPSLYRYAPQVGAGCAAALR